MPLIYIEKKGNFKQLFKNPFFSIYIESKIEIFLQTPDPSFSKQFLERMKGKNKKNYF